MRKARRSVAQLGLDFAPKKTNPAKAGSVGVLLRAYAAFCLLRRNAKRASCELLKSPHADDCRPRAGRLKPNLLHHCYFMRCQLNGPKALALLTALALGGVACGMIVSFSHSSGAVLPCTTTR